MSRIILSLLVVGAIAVSASAAWVTGVPSRLVVKDNGEITVMLNSTNYAFADDNDAKMNRVLAVLISAYNNHTSVGVFETGNSVYITGATYPKCSAVKVEK